AWLMKPCIRPNRVAAIAWWLQRLLLLRRLTQGKEKGLSVETDNPFFLAFGCYAPVLRRRVVVLRVVVRLRVAGLRAVVVRLAVLRFVVVFLRRVVAGLALRTAVPTRSAALRSSFSSLATVFSSPASRFSSSATGRFFTTP